MNGLMMSVSLNLRSIIEHGTRVNGDGEIVSVTRDNPRHRYTYKDAFTRANQLASAMSSWGLEPGDRVATLAWNDYRHFETYYAVGCSGYVTHTINPRLFPEQLVFIINHADDQYVFLDADFVPLVEKIADQCPGVKGYVVMISEDQMPETTLPNAMCYETLVASAAADYEWPDVDENAACALCYTSGTTGNPKGVLYSHRSTILHAYAGLMPDAMGLGQADVILPIVPMFHVNAWGLPYACPMIGAKMVMPGNKMGDGETLAALINEENVTFSAGVPTVWLSLINYLKQSGMRVESLRRVIVGGSACPLSIMEDFDTYGVETRVGWGMTEMSPLGTTNPSMDIRDEIPADEFAKLRLKAGRPIYGCEVKITDDDNNELPWDGVAFGSLKVRGPWICSAYYKLDGSSAHGEDGWFETGDVATIDPRGYIAITDRTKDVIKSGGEWISSIDVENVATDHPKVAEAAVIGRIHDKWGERPLLIVVRNAQGADLTAEEITAWFDGKIAKWWTPDAVEFIDEMPHTATGKIQKTTLRDMFADFTFSR
ncbi:Medium-chain-fatty-acid--CoA ligase [Aequoribacter fuscus]|uniref:Medium-chain-fatty-acid--CoA ligase n=1 Tax=Aequoribacter fuscus TaxID=2518989 RepID=F3L1I3_9GAMM|nr:long-chain-fatty-acid--CoA ligase [Aequoribacter fuscus]EGG29779.1 Medium-chain-fatty-acid--CoA ligase [Aequoribacter fuscus]QHJ87624.1 long-chain-fatty-acid--CoA ligase [Aequoribacter fuscus]